MSTRKNSYTKELRYRFQEIIDIISNSYKTICATNGTIVISITMDRDAKKVIFEAAYSTNASFNPTVIYELLLSNRQFSAIPVVMNTICQKYSGYNKYYEENQITAWDLYIIEDWE